LGEAQEKGARGISPPSKTAAARGSLAEAQGGGGFTE